MIILKKISDCDPLLFKINFSEDLEKNTQLLFLSFFFLFISLILGSHLVMLFMEDMNVRDPIHQLHAKKASYRLLYHSSLNSTPLKYIDDPTSDEQILSSF